MGFQDWFNKVVGSPKQTQPSQTPGNHADMQREVVRAVIERLRPYHFAKPRSVVRAIHFVHSEATEGMLFEALRQPALRQGVEGELRVELLNHGLSLAPGFEIDFVEDAERLASLPPLFKDIGLDIEMQGEGRRLCFLHLTALSGIMHEESYALRSDELERAVFLGRCLNPQVAGFGARQNIVAFVGAKEEEPEAWAKHAHSPEGLAQLELNRYVSRSTALLRYNRQEERFELALAERRQMAPLSLSIYRLRTTGEQNQIGLRIPHRYYALEDGDIIVINEKVSLKVEVRN